MSYLARAVFAVLWVTPGLAEASSFELLPSWPAALSSDGRTVVGLAADSRGETRPASWTHEGGLTFPDGFPAFSIPADVSLDLDVVVGTTNPTHRAEDLHAFLWTAGAAGELIPMPPGTTFSFADAVSQDGGVIVGSRGHDSRLDPYRWTAGDGVVDLVLPAGALYAAAFDVSADGRVVVGHADSIRGSEAFLWTLEGGMVGLGNLPGPPYSYSGVANAISADGSTIVGYSGSVEPAGSQAFRWTAGTGMIGLGDLPGGFFASTALDVSADGSVVVGTSGSTVVDTVGREWTRAFIWTQATGMRALEDVLVQDYGLDLHGTVLSDALRVSADGRTILGFTTEGAFLAVLPEPAVGLLLPMVWLALLLVPAWVYCARRRRSSSMAFEHA